MSRSLTGAYLEAKFKALVAKVGGAAYDDGSTVNYSGVLDKTHLSPGLRISNGQKNEPYALTALQFRLPYPQVSASNSLHTMSRMYLPSWLTAVSADTSIVSANFAYAGLTAGTAATTTLLIYRAAGLTTTTMMNASTGSVAPATVAVLTLTDTSLVGMDYVQCSCQVASITGGAGTDHVIDAVVTLICKSKHVA